MRGGGDRRLFALLGRNLAVGVGVGLALSIAFYALDLGGFRSLTAATRDGGTAIFIFTFAMVFTFGAMAMGVGVMLHPRDPSYGHDMRERGARDD